MGPWESVPAPAVAEGGRAGTGAGPRETGNFREERTHAAVRAC